jgi:hypothetical protein
MIWLPIKCRGLGIPILARLMQTPFIFKRVSCFHWFTYGWWFSAQDQRLTVLLKPGALCFIVSFG